MATEFFTSSQTITTDSSSKKRKHKDETREARKKRKQAEKDSLSIQIVQSEPLKQIESTEKKKRKDKRADRVEPEGQDGEIVAQQPRDQSVDLNGSTSSKEKKVKRQRRPSSSEDLKPVQLPALDDIEEQDEQGQQSDAELPDVEAEIPPTQYETIAPGQLDSAALSPFYTVNLSLLLPLPSIGQSSPLSALCALHLSPLLLSYFPPANGIVLAYQNPLIISTVSKAAEDSSGASSSWVWLKVEFMVYRPVKDDEVLGHINAASEGFVGLVSYNYFTTPVERARLPKEWSYSAPTDSRTRKSKKGKLNDTSQEDEVMQDGDDGEQDEEVDRAGYFVDEDGVQIDPVQRFRVVDVDMVPGHERDKWTTATEGTLLDEEQEEALREEERRKFDLRQMRGKAKAAVMSGGIASRQHSVAPSSP